MLDFIDTGGLGLASISSRSPGETPTRCMVCPLGWLSRLSGADRTPRGLAGIDDQVEVALAAGAADFEVHVRDGDFPLLAGSLDRVCATVAEYLQTSRRMTIVATHQPDWAGVARIRVQVDRPTLAQLSQLESGSGGAALDPETLVWRDLSFWSSRAQVGSPFGLGYGLEEAADLVTRAMPDEERRRFYGSAMAQMIGQAVADKAISFDLWDQALGWDPKKLPRKAFRYLSAEGDPYKRIIGTLPSKRGQDYERWAIDGELVARLYATCIVAYRRFAEIGRLPPIDL